MWNNLKSKFQHERWIEWKNSKELLEKEGENGWKKEKERQKGVVAQGKKIILIWFQNTCSQKPYKYLYDYMYNKGAFIEK